MCRFFTRLCFLLVWIHPAVHAEVIDIDNARLTQLMKSGVPVVDVRRADEWESTGIVPGSKLLTYFDANGNADSAAWLARLKPMVRENEPVIVICRSGRRSLAVSQFLSQQAGYATVYNVKDGIQGWLGDHGAVTPAAPVLASCKAAGTC